MKQFQYFTTRYFLALTFALFIGTSAFAQLKPVAPSTAPLRPSPKIVQVDRIVAVVNDEVITQNDLNDRLATVTRNLQKQGTELPAQDTLIKQLLERMINDLIQVQLAKETGIKVDDAQLDKTMQRIAEENNLKFPEFRQLLEKDGIKWERFRDDIRNEILTGRLREREVEANIVVTESEVDNQMALEARDANSDQEFRLAHILILVPEQATSEQIELKRKRALQALGELRKGTDFAQISATYSDAPDALQGGNLGWRSAGRVPGIFLEAVNQLKPNEVSDVLRSANGFHIIKLLDKRGRTAESAALQAQVRHILLRTKDTLTDAEARERLLRLRERVVSGADFSELAKVHSEDPSAAKGGDLGWISPGETVPEFERTINTLRNGEISQPIQTQFGWHLVQVLERRSETLSEDRRRQVARQTIRARKSDEAFQEWLRQTRDRAFVEYRLEEK